MEDFAVGIGLGVSITSALLYLNSLRNNKSSTSFVAKLTKSSICSDSQSQLTSNANKEDEQQVMSLIRSNIRSLQPYRCARDDYSIGILLDANENRYGNPLQNLPRYQGIDLSSYPCPYQMILKKRIAAFRKVQPQQIFLGVGSDEAIDLIIRICCSPGSSDGILVSPPTYGMYHVCANIHDIIIHSIPLIPKRSNNTTTFQLNMPEMLSFLNSRAGRNIKIVFLCSPGNPTGQLLTKSDINCLLRSKFRGFIVVDEAYVDFADNENAEDADPSMMGLLHKYPRLIVLQTFSKSFGLAGIRLGMAFGHPRLIEILNKVKAPYNINNLTSSAALEALECLSVFYENIKNIKSERNRLLNILKEMKQIVKVVYPSDANFIIFKVDNAYEIYQLMAKDGVVVRYRGHELHLEDCLRVTIGTPQENDKMLRLLKEKFIYIQKKENPQVLSEKKEN